MSDLVSLEIDHRVKLSFNDFFYIISIRFFVEDLGRRLIVTEWDIEILLLQDSDSYSVILLTSFLQCQKAI